MLLRVWICVYTSPVGRHCLFLTSKGVFWTTSNTDLVLLLQVMLQWIFLLSGLVSLRDIPMLAPTEAGFCVALKC